MTDLGINALINNHFCIKNASFERVLNALCQNEIQIIQFDKNFDWSFLYDENIKERKRFVLFDTVGEWTYLMVNEWDDSSLSANLNELEQFIVSLSLHLQTEVYYFFIDPWVFACEWILSDKGRIIKKYCESLGVVLFDEGHLHIESEIRERLRPKPQKGLLNRLFKSMTNEYWEDKYWELNAAVCAPIETLNNYNTIKAAIGEL